MSGIPRSFMKRPGAIGPVTDQELISELRNGRGVVGMMAADRLAELQSALDTFRSDHENYLAYGADLDTLRPTCPRCGGTTVVDMHGVVDNPTVYRSPCPDCADGRMPFERMAAVVREVFREPVGDDGPTIAYLRSVKP